MKKYFLFLSVLLLISVTSFANDTNKIKILVLPFYTKGNLDTKLIDSLYDNFIKTIDDTKNYSTITKNRLETTLEIAEIQKKSDFTNQEAVEIGKLVRAKVVIVGSISLFDDGYYVSIKGINVNNGDELFIKTFQVSNEKNLSKLPNKLADYAFKTLNDNEYIKSNFYNDSKDEMFINMYYEYLWGFAPDNYYKSRSKYNQFLGAAGALISTGAIVSLAGMIATIALLMYRAPISDPPTGNTDPNYPYMWPFAAIVGSTTISLGLIICSLCSIPFYFAKRISQIYERRAGKELSFIDRVNFTAEIVTTKNSLTNEYEKIISFGVSLSL